MHKSLAVPVCPGQEVPISSPEGMWTIGQEVSDVPGSIKAAADMALSLSGCQGLRGWVGIPLLGCNSLVSWFFLKAAILSEGQGNAGGFAAPLKALDSFWGLGLGINARGRLRKAVSVAIRSGSCIEHLLAPNFRCFPLRWVKKMA